MDSVPLCRVVVRVPGRHRMAAVEGHHSRDLLQRDPVASAVPAERRIVSFPRARTDPDDVRSAARAWWPRFRCRSRLVGVIRF